MCRQGLVRTEEGANNHHRTKIPNVCSSPHFLKETKHRYWIHAKEVITE